MTVPIIRVETSCEEYHRHLEAIVLVTDIIGTPTTRMRCVIGMDTSLSLRISSHVDSRIRELERSLRIRP